MRRMDLSTTSQPMATKDGTMRARIEHLKTDLRSISTCTASTSLELQRLLADSASEGAQKENSTIKISQSRNVQSTMRKRGATASSTVTATSTTHGGAPLTAKEKYILATEVANVSLKSLADALKSQTTSNSTRTERKAASPSNGEAMIPAKRHMVQKRNKPVAQRPLQERSASQIVNSPTKPSLPRRSLSYSSCLPAGTEPGLVAMAECATIAFSYLRTPQAVTMAGKVTAALQLENGILALVSKLVAHGFSNLAVKELRILKRRLQTFLDADQQNGSERRSGTNGKKRQGKVEMPAEKESLASLLDFGDFDQKSPALPLITSHQILVVRILAKVRRPRLTEESWDYIKFSSSSSPANLLYHVAASSKGDPKAIRQLESFAQIVLSMCPSISNSEDAQIGDECSQLSPEIAFSLQQLAFKTRKRWWALAGHQANEQKELLEPFSRCLAAFARRSTLAPVKTYKTAELLCTDLLGPLSDPNMIQNSGTHAVGLLARTLSTLAQAAGKAEEALRWLELSDTPNASKDSAAKKTSMLIRKATLSLEATLRCVEKAELENDMEATLNALSGPLSGSSSELDVLFTDVNALRRVASKALCMKTQTTPSLHSHIALRIISACVRFSIRFLGPTLHDTKNTFTHKNRLLIVRKCVKSIIDSICVCSKLTVENDQALHWESLNSLIQDGISILKHFDEDTESGKDSLWDGQHPFVKLSNAYWAVHLQLLPNGGPDLSHMAMQESVSVLQGRSQAEQQAGVIAMKLEKLGNTYDTETRFQDSRASFLGCIRSFIDSGVLAEATEIASKHPIQHVFNTGGAVASFGRVLRSYHRSYLRHGVKNAAELAFFDDSDLPAAARGLVLEWQLSLYSKALSRNRVWDSALNPSVHAMTELLLDIYDQKQFPIRRRRLCASLIHLCQDHPDIITFKPLDSEMIALSDAVRRTSQDVELMAFDRHLRALLKLKMAMQEVPDMSSMRESFSAWQSIVASVSSWESLADEIDDVDFWLRALQTSAEYLYAKGEEYVSLSVMSLLVKVLDLQEHLDPSWLVTSYSTLGTQLLRLGYSGRTGLTFVKAEVIMARRIVSTEAKLLWHIGYAEYLLCIGNRAKCESVLCSAENIARGDGEFLSLAKPSTPLPGRVKLNRILADACYVSSLFATANGYHKDAARYVRQCVTLHRRTWAALESNSISNRSIESDGSGSKVGDAAKGTLDLSSSIRTEQGVPLVMSNTHQALDGPQFWSLVPGLYRAFMQHSVVYARQGLFQEAVHAAEQAKKIASATGSRSLLIENYSYQAEIWARSGRSDKAHTALGNIDLSQPFKHLSLACYYSSIARVLHAEGKYDEELDAYSKLENLLNDISMPTFVKSFDSFSSDVDGLTEQISTMSLASSKPTKRKPAKSTRDSKPAPKASSRKVQKTNDTPRGGAASIADECYLIQHLRADVLRRRALVSLAQDNIAQASELLDNAQTLEKSPDRSILHLWISFKTMLSQSMRELAKDFAFNTLPESTIAFPAINHKERRASAEIVTTGPNMAKLASAKRGKGKKAPKLDFIAVLGQAREHLIESHALCSRAGSNHEFQRASSALSHVTVLLSAISGSELHGVLHPLYSAYMNEIPKHRSLLFEQDSLEAEQQSVSREECLTWPQLSLDGRSTLGLATDFQRDYVDIIPKSWTAISLSLNDDQNELYITRFDRDAPPFVLRLPMARHSSRDMDEEEFSFLDGKRDFEEIIELSDFSTRSAKDMTSKEARLQWWTEREALDARLHELLLNIENIWLGGFRGIFSEHPRQPALLARFRKSFDNILNLHLPSRQGKAKLPSSKTILDARVLELFIGLGDATNEELDLDEALMDLIYFIVDILQFNGEHNAYDEVDFDAMVVETLDALRAYHSASQIESKEAAHTILILDKSLHIFPWESLPCLQKLSISRLPSLAALRERLLAARSPSAKHNTQLGHYISAEAGGTSILNPSRDLSHTVKTLKPRLDDMKGTWTHITNRPPSEKEFESALRESDLVLYFGHGSGSQFVKSKSVRRLYPGREAAHEKPECATTFLFGCSSVHLSENGIYEPSGMLASYLVAGAPAVLGMLWDVTDKDCDRFAVKAGELWGLWPAQKEEEEVPRTTKKSKNKGKVAQLVAEVEGARGANTGKKAKRSRDETETEGGHSDDANSMRRRGIGLDEAVRTARDACVLRYLNGAAAVVYGIPVYLE